MHPKRLDDLEKELAQAIEGMEEALKNANGACSQKIRRRTVKVRRSLKELARENPVEQD